MRIDLFNSRDLYNYDSVKKVHNATKNVDYYYVWIPIIELDKAMNGGKSNLMPIIEVDSNDKSITKHMLMQKVRNVLNQYSQWMQSKNEFCKGNLRTIVPLLDVEAEAYWKLFCDAFYINSYTKFCNVLQGIRTKCALVDSFEQSFNNVISNYLQDVLVANGTEDFCIQTLCDNKYTCVEQYGLMYWWLEPYMRIEFTIKAIKKRIQRGEYDKYIDIVDDNYTVI